MLGAPASPWTEPALEVAAALLAGNGVVLAPAAPLAGERLRRAFLRAGIPEELLAVVHGDEAREALPGACARVVSLEGPETKGAMLVLEGAPVEQVAAAALWAAFAAGGRHPAAAGRLVCVPSMAEPLLGAIGRRAERLRVGDPASEETEVGPLRSAEDLAIVEALVEEAVAGGAELVCGGATRVAGLAGAFYAPAVLRRVPAEARILREAAARAGARGRRGEPARPPRSPWADGPATRKPHDRRARGGVVSIWAARPREGRARRPHARRRADLGQRARRRRARPGAAAGAPRRPAPARLPARPARRRAPPALRPVARSGPNRGLPPRPRPRGGPAGGPAPRRRAPGAGRAADLGLAVAPGLGLRPLCRRRRGRLAATLAWATAGARAGGGASSAASSVRLTSL